MNIDIWPDDLRNDVQPSRRAGAGKSTVRGVTFNLANGDTITFWLGQDIKLRQVLTEGANMADLLLKEAER